MKSKYRAALSVPEIESRYPDEWVIVEVTKIDTIKSPLFGRVLAHSRNRRDIVKINRAFSQRNPRRMTCVFFAGPVAPEGHTVII
jgi:hypothetical protein